jgi:hypothetical protein
MKGDFETWYHYVISATNSIPKFKVKETHFLYVLVVMASEMKLKQFKTDGQCQPVSLSSYHLLMRLDQYLSKCT